MEDDDLRLAARVRLPVLITAASSRERDLSARLIHANGGLSRGPFVTVCVDRPPRLRHLFDQARGGTLFIDDVAALNAEAQRQLLALLEGDRSVRLIAGASRHLDADRAAGVFSDTLFYRLNVIHVDLTSESHADDRRGTPLS